MVNSELDPVQPAEIRGPESTLQQVDAATTASDEASLSVGVLIGFYRRRRKWSQQDLAKKVSEVSKSPVTPSTIAAFESAQRRPSQQMASDLSRALDLGTTAHRQLEELIARPSIPKGMWLLPEDVLYGTPLFVRSLEREAVLQKDADISSMWIVTRRPMALQEEVFKALKERVLGDKGDIPRLVYFIDSRIGKKPVHLLWDRLSESDKEQRKKVCDRLKFVLSPAALCLQHFGISNPGKADKMFGRLILYSNGLPFGYVGMDSQRVADAYEVLFLAYEECKDRKGEAVKTRDGDFTLINEDEERNG